MRYRRTSPEIERVARIMRASLTPSERRLWSCLKSGRLGGASFRAQHPLGQVVLDFGCCSAKLASAVTGRGHESHMQAHARWMKPAKLLVVLS